MPRTGRRPGTGGTREQILECARSQFAEAGYEGATIRAIATDAGVDPALVLHYFGSKEGVFLAAVDFPIDPAEFVPGLLAPGLDGLGERVATFFFETWDSPKGGALLGVLRAAMTNERAASLLRDFVSREVLSRLADALEVDRPQLRAALAASHLIGLALIRYVAKVEPLASAAPAELARWVGPAVQRYFTDPNAIERAGRC